MRRCSQDPAYNSLYLALSRFILLVSTAPVEAVITDNPSWNHCAPDSYCCILISSTSCSTVVGYWCTFFCRTNNKCNTLHAGTASPRHKTLCVPQVRTAATAVAVAVAAGSSALLPSKLAAFAHLSSWALFVGANLWNTVLPLNNKLCNS
jgi:hypothetical protein